MIVAKRNRKQKKQHAQQARKVPYAVPSTIGVEKVEETVTVTLSVSLDWCVASTTVMILPSGRNMIGIVVWQTQRVQRWAGDITPKKHLSNASFFSIYLLYNLNMKILLMGDFFLLLTIFYVGPKFVQLFFEQ